MKKALFTTLLALGITTSAMGGQAFAAEPAATDAVSGNTYLTLQQQLAGDVKQESIISPEWSNCSYGPASFSFKNSLTVQKKMNVEGGGTYGNGTVRVVFDKAAYFYVKLVSAEGNSVSYYMNGATSHYFYNMRPSMYTVVLSDDGSTTNNGTITMYWDGYQN